MKRILNFVGLVVGVTMLPLGVMVLSGLYVSVYLLDPKSRSAKAFEMTLDAFIDVGNMVLTKVGRFPR